MAEARPAGTFRRADRIRRHLEFQEAQKKGRRVTTTHFVLLVYARTSAPRARLGIVASRKVGTAVMRNRAKRLVREAFRATRGLWMAGIDLVVIVRRPLSNMKLDDVSREWLAAAVPAKKRMEEAFRDLEGRVAVESGARER